MLDGFEGELSVFFAEVLESELVTFNLALWKTDVPVTNLVSGLVSLTLVVLVDDRLRYDFLCYTNDGGESLLLAVPCVEDVEVVASANHATANVCAVTQPLVDKRELLACLLVTNNNVGGVELLMAEPLGHVSINCLESILDVLQSLGAVNCCVSLHNLAPLFPVAAGVLSLLFVSFSDAKIRRSL